MEQARSPMNPTDAAFMMKTGQMSPDMTIGEMLEKSYGIKWDDPLGVASQKMKKAMVNAKPEGKIRAMSGGQGGPPQGGPQKPMPQGAKPAVQSGGLDGLLNRMG